MLTYAYSGIGLIALGLAFMLAEVFVPTSGALAVGGVAAFVIGAVFLVDTDLSTYGISWPLILTTGAAIAVFALLAAGMAVRARRRPVVTGHEEMVGATGEVMADFTGEGWATVHGETWRVRSSTPMKQGEQLRVTGIVGLVLDVELQTVESTRSAQ